VEPTLCGSAMRSIPVRRVPDRLSDAKRNPGQTRPDGLCDKDSVSLTAKALFVIERNLAQELSLASVATACDVSRFHLAHAFAAAAGRPVIDYVRSRRLTEAAHALTRGAPNILDVAMNARYASHEAFSRAFRAQFGLTPEQLRERGTLTDLTLTETLTMAPTQTLPLPPPTYKSMGEQLFVGLAAERRMGEAAKIPVQWRQFMSGPYQQIKHKLDQPPVGVTLLGDADEQFVYVCAAQVSRFTTVPKDLLQVTVEPAQYAVFAHDSHVSELPQTYAAIWNEWFAESGKVPMKAASLEHHNAAFDPGTGTGGVTVWIPIL
jgi:AraC family transcriptional regulator